MRASRPLQVTIAFAIVYLVWGSTYLAIRIGVQDLPPVLFAGVRFLLAAPLMFAYAWLRGARLPSSRRDWALIGLTAVLMLVGGNGLVTWAEHWVESNQAALIIATSAIWMAALGALGGRGDRLSWPAGAGLLLGLAGVALLVGGGLQLRSAPWFAYAALLAAPILWAAGSVIARRYPLGCAPLMAAALQMLVTGVIMTALGLALGDARRWSPTPESLGALLYLVVFGSCIAYGAYYWLVHEVTPAQLGTYAYVNPAIAVLLGWWWLDEVMALPQIAGTLVILAGVVLVTLASRAPPVR
ncbi:EamA family transporter [Sinimarinibacterium thermocellulolyticum]|uniref:EamA family transporter n=1 Tax=Sinimarinibacterium thermocellulolyticum TaxID=3170016 RepID=A0ABV2A7B0_9GAMM